MKLYKLTPLSVPFAVFEARAPQDEDGEATLLRSKIEYLFDGKVEGVEVSRGLEITIACPNGKLCLVENGEYPPGYTLELHFKEENNVYQIKL